ncbi:hypothetical protein CRUP_013583, partial [Coryphaenoides rupestris]
MADKRRSGATSVLLSEAKTSNSATTTTTTTISNTINSTTATTSTTSISTTRSESDRLLLSQLGVGELLRGAILKMVEARSDDPIGFLADHFCNLAASSAVASAFSNNVLVAYDLLSDTATAPSHPSGAPASDGPPGASSPGPDGGGVRGGLYTQALQCLCSEGGVPASTSAPLLRRLHCQDHEAVPYDLFRQGVLTCAVFSDYIRQAQRLYADVCCPAEGPASRALCLAVLGTLRDALETSSRGGATTWKASAKSSPCRVAQVMARGAQAGGPGGNMDAKEFENAAAELFIAR